MSSVSGAPSPRTSSGRARIASATRDPPSSRSSRANACAMRSSVRPYVTTPQPSTAVGMRRGLDLRRARRPRRAAPAGTGCDARRYPSVGQPRSRQSSSIAACLPEQLCSILVGSGPHSRSSSVAFAFVEEAPHRLELVGPVEMRRGRDRDLRVVEIRSRPDDRQRLERFRGAAEEREERRIARRRDDLPVRDGDRVHAMARLDDARP